MVNAMVQRALMRVARIQVGLALGASMLVMRALATQVAHDDARVRLAARAAHWYLARRERERGRGTHRDALA